MLKNFLIFFVLIILLGSCSKKSESPNSDITKLKSFVASMESKALSFNAEIEILKEHYEFLINHRDSLGQSANRNKYQFQDGYSSNLPGKDSALSTIFISTLNLDFEKAKEEVALTNGLDSVFFNLFHKNKLIAQVYSNSATNVSRVYPAYDAKNLISPDVDIRAFNFYYEADLKHNPDKGPVWISEAYVDPAGRGWIFSLIQPVYEGNNLFAVLGIDFTIDDYIHQYLEEEEGNLLIVNGKGDIVAGKSSAIEVLSLPPLKNHVYRETIKMDNFRISDFNLFNSKSKEVREMAESILFEKNQDYTFNSVKGLQITKVVPFQIVDWYLLELN